MLITKMDDFDKAKVKVEIDDSFSFTLLRKDIEKYNLEAGKEITQEEYEKLLYDIILPRAKQKALDVLKFMDRTEQELRKKLEAEFYPEDIIDKAIAYVAEYGYLNDERYAGNYIRMKKDQKSKLFLKTELLNKGINKDIIDNILSMEYQTEDEDPEVTAIKKLVAKKTSDIKTLTWEEKQKLIAFLYRKGFSIEKVRHILEQ